MERLPPPEDEEDRKAKLLEALEVVSRTLHNTPAVCEEFYVHPAIVEGYLERGFVPGRDRANAPRIPELRRAEVRFLALIDGVDEVGPED